MVDEYQVEYEYSAGNTISFKTNDLKIKYTRPFMHVDVRVDGTIIVTDPGLKQNIYTFTSTISGDNMDILDGVQRAAITYTGDYPRIKKVYWDGDSTETNVEVALTSLEVLDRGAGWWRVAVTLTEKTA